MQTTVEKSMKETENLLTNYSIFCLKRQQKHNTYQGKLKKDTNQGKKSPVLSCSTC